MPHRRELLAGLAVLAACRGLRASAAGGLGVAPTLLEIDAASGNSLLFVSNGGADPLTIQVRLFAWRNIDGREELTPATDIEFSPGQFIVNPGSRQIVRLAARTPPTELERSYRVAVDQLPGLAQSGAVEMPIRHMVPLFVGPGGSTPAEPALTWSAVLDRESGRVTLTALNGGRRRVRLASLAWRAGDRQVLIAEGLAGYVLAGGTWLVRFPMIGQPDRLSISARTERGQISADVPLVVT